MQAMKGTNGKYGRYHQEPDGLFRSAAFVLTSLLMLAGPYCTTGQFCSNESISAIPDCSDRRFLPNSCPVFPNSIHSVHAGNCTMSKSAILNSADVSQGDRVTITNTTTVLICRSISMSASRGQAEVEVVLTLMYVSRLRTTSACALLPFQCVRNATASIPGCCAVCGSTHGNMSVGVVRPTSPMTFHPTPPSSGETVEGENLAMVLSLMAVGCVSIIAFSAVLTFAYVRRKTKQRNAERSRRMGRVDEEPPGATNRNIELQEVPLQLATSETAGASQGVPVIYSHFTPAHTSTSAGPSRNWTPANDHSRTSSVLNHYQGDDGGVNWVEYPQPEHVVTVPTDAVETLARHNEGDNDPEPGFSKIAKNTQEGCPDCYYQSQEQMRREVHKTRDTPV